MPEDTEQPLTVLKRVPGHRFEVNHPRYGGRKRNATQQVRALCEEMDVDPMRFMLSLIKDGVTTQTVIEGGKKKRVEVVASLEMRADLAKYVSRFMYPTLTASQITGADEGPIELEALTVSLEAIMQDPEAVAAAQTLSLLIDAREAAPAARICAPEDGRAEQERAGR